MPVDQQAADRPDRRRDPLRDRLPPEPGRHADGDAGRPASPWQTAKAEGGGGAPLAMTSPVVWWVVVALAGVQLLLSRLRVGLCARSLATWVGIYVFLRFGFTAPIPASVISLYMGIVTGAILAYVTLERGASRRVLRAARPPHDRAALRRRCSVSSVALLPALAAFERLRQMNVAARAAGLRADGPSGTADRDHGPRQDDRSDRPGQPLPAARDERSGGVPPARRERPAGLLPELRLLPRRQHGAATACSRTG